MKKIFVMATLASLLYGCGSMNVVADYQQHISTKYLTSSPRPTVIIAHGCDGNENPSYNDWARLIRSWGYNAVVSDSFQFRGYGTGSVCENPLAVMPETRANDLDKLASYVKSQPWHEGKVAVIGFSHGGSTVFNIANSNTNIDAGIAYYPSCLQHFIGISSYNTNIPVQVHLAEKDDWTPIHQCNYLPDTEKYVYEGATHAFDMQLPDRNYLGHKMRYDRKSDTMAKNRVKEFLNNTLH